MSQTLPTQKTLEIINRFITVKGPKKDQVERIVLQFIYGIVKKLKKMNLIFAEIFYVIVICGSWRDNIKIIAPDEIDLNLVFDLAKARIKRTGQGHVNIDISAYKSSKLFQFANSQGFLLVNEFQSWLEGLLSRLKINESLHTVLDHTLRINLSKNGPAHMFSMEIIKCPPESLLEPGFKFSVDLTPGIRGTKANWVSRTHPTGVKVKWEWVVIAKPLNGAANANVFFVPSFPHQESAIMNGKNNMKVAIRLIKKIAQTKSIGNLKSYFIKTAFLWKNKQDATFWNKPLNEVVEKMLEKLIKCFEKRVLRNYWFPKRNEFRKFSENQIDTIRMQLESALKTFRTSRNTVELFNLFATINEKEKLLKFIEKTQLK